MSPLVLHVLGLRAVGHSYGKRIVPCLQNRHTKRELGRKELSGGYCQRFVCVAEIGIVAKKGLSQEMCIRDRFYEGQHRTFCEP